MSLAVSLGCGTCDVMCASLADTGREMPTGHPQASCSLPERRVLNVGVAFVWHLVWHQWSQGSQTSRGSKLSQSHWNKWSHHKFWYQAIIFLLSAFPRSDSNNFSREKTTIFQSLQLPNLVLWIWVASCRVQFSPVVCISQQSCASEVLLNPRKVPKAEGREDDHVLKGCN